MQEKTT